MLYLLSVTASTAHCMDCSSHDFSVTSRCGSLAAYSRQLPHVLPWCGPLYGSHACSYKRAVKTGRNEATGNPTAGPKSVVSGRSVVRLYTYVSEITHVQSYMFYPAHFSFGYPFFCIVCKAILCSRPQSSLFIQPMEHWHSHTHREIRLHDPAQKLIFSSMHIMCPRLDIRTYNAEGFAL